MSDYLQDHVLLARIYKSLFENNPDANYAINTQGNFIMVNDSASKLTGYSKNELLNLSFMSLIKKDSMENSQRIFYEVLKGKREAFEVSILHKNGESVDLFITAFPILIDNKIMGIAGIVQDITPKNNTQMELSIARNQLQTIFDSMDICLWSSTIHGTSMFPLSPACEKIYGYSQESFKRNPSLWREVVHPNDVNILDNMMQNLLNGQPNQSEYRIIDEKGNVKWVLSSSLPVINDVGDLIRIDGVVIDISQRRNAEETLRFMAFHDTLTELPNRSKFNSQLEMAIKLAKDTHTKVAVLFIDLDHFKLINETLGYRIGDELLQIISKRLIGCLSRNDIVSRQSGDEFTVLLKNITNFKQVEIVANNLLSMIRQPFNLNGYEYTLTASIGISVFPELSEYSEDLLKQADYAMYLAKSNGKNTYQFYQSGMTEKLARTIELAQSLLKALKKNEFSLNYQPIINIQTRQIVGFEALLRWNHSVMGYISPAEFIPIAENSGLIVPIGEWVIRTACSHGKQLHERGYPFMYISVNVSARQFEEKNFVAKLKNILNETNFSPQFLKIEITESTVMNDLEDLATKLSELTEIGIDVLLDDFGTGYSSLSYLKKLPIKTLKIDRSFIQDINNDNDQESIIRTIVTMAKSLRMGVIAEGVELEKQISFLKGIECFDLQGFLFSQPVPFEKVNELLGQWNLPIPIKE